MAMRGWVYIHFVELAMVSCHSEYNWMKYVDFKKDVTSVLDST